MDEVKEILKSNRLDDVTWLCSLSESELDLVISLKKLVLRRAKIIGHEELAKKFDLKTLRGLGLVLMENIGEKIKVAPLAPSLAESAAAGLDGCNLLKSDVDDTITDEDIMALLCVDSRKKSRKRMREKEKHRQKKHDDGTEDCSEG